MPSAADFRPDTTCPGRSGATPLERTGAGQKHFAPGVKVGEVHRGSRRAIERFHIRGKLDQVTGDESGCQAEMAKKVNEQPAGVATRAGAERESLFRRVDARLEAN